MNTFEGYRITSPYGWRTHPVYEERRFHTGIDLVKAHKAPILAFVAGEILFAGPGVSGSGFGNYGNVVAVKDRKGHLHCYCHLDSIGVVKGQSVKQGQEIGKQGNTGIGTGSHLHYEIRKKVSPSYGWISDAEQRAFEPTQYLVEFYKETEAKPAPKPDPAVKKTRFTDVPVGHWAEDVIAAVDKADIMDGYADGTFGLNKPVTRAELAVVIAKIKNLV